MKISDFFFFTESFHFVLVKFSVYLIGVLS